MEKRATHTITVFNDGTIHVQQLHEATTATVSNDDASSPADDGTPSDGGSDTPGQRPGNP